VNRLQCRIMLRWANCKPKVFALGVLLVLWNVGARRLGESVDKDPAVRTIPLSVAYGPEHDPGRVFSVPVECNQVK
jgi:hypothetical protein